MLKKLVFVLIIISQFFYLFSKDKFSDAIGGIIEGKSSKVKKYLKKNGDPNKLDQNGLPLIIIAIINNQNEIVKLLIKYGADLNIADKEGKPAVFYAIDNNNKNVFKNFMNEKINYERKLYNNLSILDYAKEKKSDKIIEMIKKEITISKIKDLTNFNLTGLRENYSNLHIAYNDIKIIINSKPYAVKQGNSVNGNLKSKMIVGNEEIDGEIRINKTFDSQYNLFQFNIEYIFPNGNLLTGKITRKAVRLKKDISFEDSFDMMYDGFEVTGTIVSKAFKTDYNVRFKDTHLTGIEYYNWGKTKRYYELNFNNLEFIGLSNDSWKLEYKFKTDIEVNQLLFLLIYKELEFFINFLEDD
ncbi:MAG: ankyrin repeat domain-containing protein [Spirochaetes bacterium]|nr:ankyrin repeat domain-containing protein [Spirochaetota bacterium]